MSEKERLQVNIRMDGEQGLYELVKQEAAREKTSVNQFIINALRVAVGADKSSFTLDNIQPMIDKALDERLANLGVLDNMPSKTLDEGLTQERIEEIIDQRVAYLIEGMNQIKADVENEVQFLKTEIDFLKQVNEAPAVRSDALDRLPSAVVPGADQKTPVLPPQNGLETLQDEDNDSGQFSGQSLPGVTDNLQALLEKLETIRRDYKNHRYIKAQFDFDLFSQNNLEMYHRKRKNIHTVCDMKTRKVLFQHKSFDAVVNFVRDKMNPGEQQPEGR